LGAAEPGRIEAVTEALLSSSSPAGWEDTGSSGGHAIPSTSAKRLGSNRSCWEGLSNGDIRRCIRGGVRFNLGLECSTGRWDDSPDGVV